MNLYQLILDPTFRSVLIGTALVGAVSGAIGCFACLRRQSLVGDVIAHSSLFGVMVFFLGSYLLTGTGSKSLLILVPGAIVAGILALWVNKQLLNQSRVRPDSSLGVMLAVFFGGGIFLLRWLQRTSPPIPGQRGLEGYLFGEAALMTRADLAMIGLLAVLALLLLVTFWKELKVLAVDPEFAGTVVSGVRWLELLLIVLLVVGIVIGIQSIGVVLMIAMLVTPAAAARQWTRSLGAMVGLAALIGGLSAGAGSTISATVGKMPTGPVIVLCCVTVFFLSILLAPGRGVLVRGRPPGHPVRASGQRRGGAA